MEWEIEIEEWEYTVVNFYIFFGRFCGKIGEDYQKGNNKNKTSRLLSTIDDIIFRRKHGVEWGFKKGNSRRVGMTFKNEK